MTDKDIFNEFDREEWEKAIYNWVHDELDRKMLIRRYLDGKKISDISEEVNLSDNQCQRRVSKAKKQLFKHIKINKNNIAVFE